MKRILLSFLLAFAGIAALSAANNRLFEDRYNALPDKTHVVEVGGDWFPYPAYSDRAGWDKLLGKYKADAIKAAEKFLDYKWQPLTATSYLEFEQTGDRKLMEPETRNRYAMVTLMLGELAEGEGRFIPKLATPIGSNIMPALDGE